MQSSSVKPGELCKKLEDDINRKLYSLTNSLSFISMVEEAMATHLDQVSVMREQSERWLDCCGLATRDDVADIARRIIKVEERLDCLDEFLYLTLREIKENRSQVVKLRSELVELIDNKEENFVADKKGHEVEQVNEPKVEEAVTLKSTNKNTKVEETTVENELKQEAKVEEPISDVEQEKVGESNTGTDEPEEQITTLDILWSHAFRELDEWVKHANFRDEVFLKEANYFAEAVLRNQENINVITEQFTKEFAVWERTAREEFLMSTTSIQHFFPTRSYEEINEQIDEIQKKTMSILSMPCHLIANNQPIDQYLDIVGKYIALRKRGRNKYINTVKQAANIIYENQKGFIDLFSKQFKNFMFPFNKYMEKTEELIK